MSRGCRRARACSRASTGRASAWSVVAAGGEAASVTTTEQVPVPVGKDSSRLSSKLRAENIAAVRCVHTACGGHCRRWR